LPRLDELSPNALNELLADFPVEDIWGIGSKKAEFLRQHGYQTAFDFLQAEDGWVRKNLTVTGLKTLYELRGISCLPIEAVPPPKKALCSAKSFGREVENLQELEEALAVYTARVAEKLRAQKSCAGVMQIFLRTNFYRQTGRTYANSAIVHLPQSSSYTPYLVQYALEGLRRIYRSGYCYHKVGVLLTDISKPGKEIQLNLFQTNTSTLEKQDQEWRLMEALDSINSKFGRDTLALGRAGIKKDWKMRQANVSPHYTTSWQDLLRCY
jgi:DNA polymerase V